VVQVVARTENSFVYLAGLVDDQDVEWYPPNAVVK